MIAPDGRVVRVGDANGATAADRIIFTHNDGLRFVLTRGVEGRPPPKHWAVFPKSGYVTFRSPWSDDPWEKASFLFFSAAFHSRTHKHADDFTFEWSELGVPLVIDSGRFAYRYDDPRRKYVESTRAHNTVEIDGRDYSRYRNDAFGSAVKAWGEISGVYFVEAQVYRKRFFKTDHRRVLFFSPGRWLVVVDLMDSPDEHGFTQWFHYNPDIELEADGKRVIAAIPGTKKQLLMLPLLNRDKMGLRLVKGQKTPRLQGWVSLEANVLKPNHAAGYTIKDNRATFVTLLWIGDEASKVSSGKTRVSLGGDGLLVSWKVDDRMHGFHFVKRGGKRQLDLIR